MSFEAAPASTASHAESHVWRRLAQQWAPVSAPIPPTESAVTGHDPRSDLKARTARWGYTLGGGDLADLCRFGAALALAEAEAWASNDPALAARAYADRRFLLGDRLIHWAVPWLTAAAETHDGALDSRADLLELGDLHRPAPRLSGAEGLHPPGEDSFGKQEVSLSIALSTLAGGVVLFGGAGSASVSHYRTATRRWMQLAADHPGTEALWADLARRARVTAERLQ